MAIDGADQIAPDGWPVKGGGAAHTREDHRRGRRPLDRDRRSSKPVTAINGPILLELLAFGPLRPRAGSTRQTCQTFHAASALFIADVPRQHHESRRNGQLTQHRPWIIKHGLFPPELISDVLTGRGNAAERRTSPTALRHRTLISRTYDICATGAPGNGPGCGAPSRPRVPPVVYWSSMEATAAIPCGPSWCSRPEVHRRCRGSGQLSALVVQISASNPEPAAQVSTVEGRARRHPCHDACSSAFATRSNKASLSGPIFISSITPALSRARP